jgi:lycopene cyclase domain-containing protein
MTYRLFLVLYLAPGVLLAMAALGGRLRYDGAVLPAVMVRRGIPAVAVLVLAAVAFTTPWDSWLIGNSVWSYPAGSVMGTLAGVPFEEFLFMAGQTVLTGCWALAVSARPATAGTRTLQPWRRPVGTVLWLLAAAAGAAVAAVLPHALYLGSILAWFGIPLALQAAAGADVLRAARAHRLRGLAITPLLWAGDAVAIHAGAWTIGPAHTVGLGVLGLPLEEAVFFLLTNVLIVNSVVLVSHPQMHRRLATWSGRRSAGRPARAAVGESHGYR